LGNTILSSGMVSYAGAFTS